VGLPSTSGSVIPASLLLNVSDMPDILLGRTADCQAALLGSSLVGSNLVGSNTDKLAARSCDLKSTVLNFHF
jgi:hypothetical protein